MKNKDIKQEIANCKENSILRIEKYPLLYNNKARVIDRILSLHQMKKWAIKFFHEEGYKKIAVIDGELYAFRHKLLELNEND